MSIDRMLSLFPNAWRSRYEAEVRELLDAHPFTWRERRDLLSACGDAWGREAGRRLHTFGRVLGLIGIRLAVLLAVGWICLQLTNVIAGLEATRSAVATGGLWVGWAAGFWMPMAFMFQLFLVKPYADSGDALDRPSWTQTLAISLLLIVLFAFDDRRPVFWHLPDMLILGAMATMRYARWFVVLDPTRSVPNHGRRVLGLQ